MTRLLVTYLIFFFTDPATTEIYTLSLHDALPILADRTWTRDRPRGPCVHDVRIDRKSTRLNSSHRCISYAVFCLKKKKQYAAGQAHRPPPQRQNQLRMLLQSPPDRCRSFSSHRYN